MAFGTYNIFGALTPTQAYALLGVLIVVLAIVVVYVIRRLRRKDSNEPVSTVDEFDKSGYVHVHEVAQEAEGASFLWFERSNGDLDDKQIGQPFTFFMEDSSIERHHLNARGSYRCIDPKQLFDGFVFSIKELNRLAALTEQHIRRLRTGSLANEKLSRHLRTFVLLFLLAGMIGIGIAAATVRH